MTEIRVQAPFSMQTEEVEASERISSQRFLANAVEWRFSRSRKARRICLSIQNRFSGVTSSVNIRHEQLAKSSGDSVEDISSPGRQLELLRPRDALEQTDRKLEEHVIQASGMEDTAKNGAF